MADGVDEVEGVLATEIAPPTRPRDHRGQFIRESANPEMMFEAREVEGDATDGGDDPILSAQDRRLNDDRERTRRSSAEEEGESGEFGDAKRVARDRHADADDGYDVPDSEPENISAEVESESAESESAEDADGDDGAQRFEVTVDGKTQQVSLNEALNGYIRQATFHRRLAEVNNAAKLVQDDYGRLQQNWSWWHKARQDYEEDVANMTPKEPDWDQEFRLDPAAAHEKQKVFQAIYGKLAASQQARAQREAAEREEIDRRTERYAVDGFTKFVMDHIKDLPDEPTLKRNVNSMRRTAMAAGFNDYEIATVYDPRMLTILWKASRFDRMTAAAPRAVVEGKGKTLAPGAATPGFGNARRSGVDDAQRQLARTGKVSDAAEVFRRIL